MPFDKKKYQRELMRKRRGSKVPMITMEGKTYEIDKTIILTSGKPCDVAKLALEQGAVIRIIENDKVIWERPKTA